MAALNFAIFFGGGLHMCVCCCTVWLMFVHVREKVMFEVYGGESESMSDQYGIFFCF